MYICNYASEYYIKGHRHTSLGRSIDPRDFHAAGPAELLDLIERLTDRTGVWGSAEDELYQALTELCHVHYDNNPEKLIERCRKAIVSGTADKPDKGKANVFICDYPSEYRFNTMEGSGAPINVAEIYKPYSHAFTLPGHDAGEKEVYDLIDRLTDRDGYDAVEDEAYEELARLCDVDLKEYDSYDAFMAACKAVIEKEKANG